MPSYGTGLERFRSKSFRFPFSEKVSTVFRIRLATSTTEPGREIGKRNFVLPSGCEFIESSLLSRQRLNLNPFHRLNEAYPDYSFHSLIGRHGTNSLRGTWRLCNNGADAV